jgi:hypothetical protein
VFDLVQFRLDGHAAATALSKKGCFSSATLALYPSGCIIAHFCPVFFPPSLYF